jgi:hypothetical protein
LHFENEAHDPRPTAISSGAKKKRMGPILPRSDDPDCGKSLPEPEIPDTIYNRISQYQQQKRMQSKTEMCFM